jgi:rhamnogalacturonyl hydrolase YesR
MRYWTFIPLSLIMLISSLSLPAQELSSKQQIIEQMERANGYFMEKWPDPGEDIVTDKVRPSNLWTRAVYYEGLMALYRITLDSALYRYAVDWGESHDWEPTYGLPYTRDGDHQCCGQTYIELFQISGDTNWIAPIRFNIDQMVESTKTDDWSWIDAIQMSMPVFAKLGTVLEDTSYFRKMYDLYSFTKYHHGDSGLYNSHDHLWWRDGNFDPPVTTPNGLQMYWSRGNGWVFAALARVLEVIPPNEIHRDEYLQDFRDMARALIALQREDGFWNSSLVDPDHYGGKETSGTGFFVYGLAWGINHGILDSATYMPYVVMGWEGMVQDALHESGFLGWVQGTGKEPKDGQPLAWDKPANFEDFGLGAFLLAGSEVWRLAIEDTVNTAISPFPQVQPGLQAFLNAYPNPALGKISIHYCLNGRSDAGLRLYDLNGRLVQILRNTDLMEAGDYETVLTTGDTGDGTIPAGVYFVRFVTGQEILTKKIMLL